MTLLIIDHVCEVELSIFQEQFHEHESPFLHFCTVIKSIYQLNYQF